MKRNGLLLRDSYLAQGDREEGARKFPRSPSLSQTPVSQEGSICSCPWATVSRAEESGSGNPPFIALIRPSTRLPGRGSAYHQVKSPQQGDRGLWGFSEYFRQLRLKKVPTLDWSLQVRTSTLKFDSYLVNSIYNLSSLWIGLVNSLGVRYL